MGLLAKDRQSTMPERPQPPEIRSSFVNLRAGCVVRHISAAVTK